MHPRREMQHECQTVRMGQRTRRGECFLALAQCLVRIAQEPQDTGKVGEGDRLRVLPVEKVQGATLLDVGEREVLFEVLSG